MVPARVNSHVTSEQRHNSLGRFHIRSDDFEDISLFETSSPLGKVNQTGVSPHRWSNDSVLASITHSSPGSSGSSEEMATPALTSDTSSIRSSLSSASTPALADGKAGLRLSFGHAKPTGRPSRRASPLPDNTSLETLTRLPSLRSRRKQRESEYDNDDGEDIWPGDGLMFNVPMSPALWAQQKRHRDVQRPPNQHQPKQPIHPLQAKRRGAVPVPIQTHCLPAINETATAPRGRRGKPAQPVPQDHFSRRYQEPANLPNQHIDGLDVDATDLTLQFAEREKDHDDMPLPTPKLPAASEDEDSSSPSSSRRTSLTRPENLPPKDPEEERKHLQEYETMIAATVAKEKRHSQSILKQREEREKQRKRDHHSWTKWLTSGSHISKTSHKFKDLRWRGIPQDLRPQVWKKVLFSRPNQPSAFTLSGDLKVIASDSERVWPELGLFGAGHALHESTCRVVQAYLGAYPAVPYQFSILGVAALFVLYMSELDATGAIISLLDPSSLNYAILAGHEQTIAANYSSFMKFLRSNFSHLDEHFNKLDLKPQDYLNNLIAGVFAPQLPIEHAARVMDVFIFEGDSFLLRASLGILKMNEARLYEDADQICSQLDKPRIPEGEDEFMTTIREVTR